MALCLCLPFKKGELTKKNGIYLFTNTNIKKKATPKIITLITMNYRIMLRLQKCLFLNIYLAGVWSVIVAFFLYKKIDQLGHLTKYLSVTVFTLLMVIESARLYLGHYGNLACRVPELAGFLMLTVLMQMPLLSFFLFNPYLLSTPTELTIHIFFWLISCTEVILGTLALKEASHFAKSIYFTQSSHRDK